MEPKPKPLLVLFNEMELKQAHVFGLLVIAKGLEARSDFSLFYRGAVKHCVEPFTEVLYRVLLRFQNRFFLKIGSK